eukprot:10650111-Prorocentrum_lima.AAC.1
MIENPHYAKLADDVQRLMNIRDGYKEIKKDNFGQVLDVAVQARLKDALNHGLLTAATTYVVYKIQSHI